MRAASLLLLAAGLPSAGAYRIMQADRLAASAGGQASQGLGRAEAEAAATAGGRARSSWQKFSLRFCVSSDVALECDDHSVLDIYSAMYGRASLGRKCKPAEPVAAREECAKNFTDTVIANCQGHQRCPLAASFHPTCASNPHYSARVVWECVVSEAKAATPEGEKAKNNVTDDEEIESVAIVPADSTSDDDDKEVFNAIAEEDKEDNALPAVPEPEQDEEEEEEEKEAPVAAEPKGGDAAKPRITTDIELTLTRCYRRTKRQMVEQKKFGKPHDCPAQESCFGLVWDDMRKYTDPSQPPDEKAMVEAELAPGRSFWVSWLRTGLRYNTPGTWGVCLPNKKGVDLCRGSQKATECRRLVYKIFNGLKEFH